MCKAFVSYFCVALHEVTEDHMFQRIMGEVVPRMSPLLGVWLTGAHSWPKPGAEGWEEIGGVFLFFFLNLLLTRTRCDQGTPSAAAHRLWIGQVWRVTWDHHETRRYPNQEEDGARYRSLRGGNERLSAAIDHNNRWPCLKKPRLFACFRAPL